MKTINDGRINVAHQGEMVVPIVVERPLMLVVLLISIKKKEEIPNIQTAKPKTEIKKLLILTIRINIVAKCVIFLAETTKNEAEFAKESPITTLISPKEFDFLE